MDLRGWRRSLRQAPACKLGLISVLSWEWYRAMKTVDTPMRLRELISRLRPQSRPWAMIDLGRIGLVFGNFTFQITFWYPVLYHDSMCIVFISLMLNAVKLHFVRSLICVALTAPAPSNRNYVKQGQNIMRQLGAVWTNAVLECCITSEVKWRHKTVHFCDVGIGIATHIGRPQSDCWDSTELLCIMALEDMQNLENFGFLSTNVEI